MRVPEIILNCKMLLLKHMVFASSHFKKPSGRQMFIWVFSPWVISCTSPNKSGHTQNFHGFDTFSLDALWYFLSCVRVQLLGQHRPLGLGPKFLILQRCNLDYLKSLAWFWIWNLRHSYLYHLDLPFNTSYCSIDAVLELYQVYISMNDMFCDFILHMSPLLAGSVEHFLYVHICPHIRNKNPTDQYFKGIETTNQWGLNSPNPIVTGPLFWRAC